MIGVKFYADGWLGPRTCALRPAFADEPGDDGLLFLDADTLARRADPFAERGWTIATHAIGDRAIEAVLDAYEQHLRRRLRRRRARIEHAQVLDAASSSPAWQSSASSCASNPASPSPTRDAARVALGGGRAERPTTGTCCWRRG